MPNNRKTSRGSSKPAIPGKRVAALTARKSEPSFVERSIAELRATVEAFGHALESFMPGVGATPKAAKSLKPRRGTKAKSNAGGARKPAARKAGARKSTPSRKTAAKSSTRTSTKRTRRSRAA